MKRIFVIFAASAIAAAAAITTPAQAQSANCLDYLTAEVTFDNKVAPHRQALKAARNMMRRPERVYRGAKRAAEQTLQRAKSIAYKKKRRAEQAADSIAGKAISEARNDYNTTPKRARRGTRRIENRREARRTYRKVLREAEAARDKTIKEANATRNKAFKDAYASYREDIKAAEAVRDKMLNEALAARDKILRPIRAAYIKAEKAYNNAHDKAQRTLGDAYTRAYANPSGPRRRVSGYAREVVLKVAVHERRRQCPSILKKQPKPR